MSNVNTNEVLFSKKIKEETAAVHQELENHRLSKAILKSDISVKDYLYYIGCMREIMKAYDEEILPRVKNLVPQSEERKKAEALHNDIAFLENKSGASTPKLKYTLPELKNDAQLMGFTYVIEGSTLGGRYIIKQGAPLLNIDEQNGASFFNGYGAQTGMMWNTFLESLNSFAADTSTHEDLISGAMAGFDSIKNYFEENCGKDGI